MFRHPLLLASLAALAAWLIVIGATHASGAQLAAPVAAAAPATGPEGFRAKFAAANVTHDGHLTRPQAEAGHMPMIVKYFDAIDSGHKGYVTLKDIQAFRQARRAAKGQ